jgi:hypothetical protein
MGNHLRASFLSNSRYVRSWEGTPSSDAHRSFRSAHSKVLGCYHAAHADRRLNDEEQEVHVEMPARQHELQEFNAGLFVAATATDLVHNRHEDGSDAVARDRQCRMLRDLLDEVAGARGRAGDLEGGTGLDGLGQQGRLGAIVDVHPVVGRVARVIVDLDGAVRAFIAHFLTAESNGSRSEAIAQLGARACHSAEWCAARAGEASGLAVQGRGYGAELISSPTVARASDTPEAR